MKKKKSKMVTIHLELDNNLYDQLVEIAKERKVSLNDLIVSILEEIVAEGSPL